MKLKANIEFSSKLQMAVYPLRMAPIGAKRLLDDLEQFIFQCRKKIDETFWIKIFVFRKFGVAFEEPQPNGPQNQLPRRILL